MANGEKLEFPGSFGAKLAARLDRPTGRPRAYALFAHCFTCSKDIAASRAIAGALADEGIAVVRFDFTGLGSSEGEFASTNFSSNVADLITAADYMREHLEAPQLLVGHSLGGAAVLAAAADIPEVTAVATIGAPSDAGHVVNNFAADLDRIETDGSANVTLAGRSFTIRKQFLDDLEGHALLDRVAGMRRPLLILQAPLDQTVGIENASAIFAAARHPKSFVSLDDADHLLSKPADAAYAARVIAAWASRYIAADAEAASHDAEAGAVVVEETGEGKFQNRVRVGTHRLLADEPTDVGGTDTGPSPYDYLSIALGACTTMTLRIYAEHKGLAVDRFSVAVSHGKVHAEDCEGCAKEIADKGGKIDRFERRIRIEGDVDDATRARLIEIADKCPVHRTLTHGSAVVTVEEPQNS
ncbi:bifunctional alpha/beta hydrolase/OsmC family protein [Amorphus orientalis]|uniref:Redox protein n=1 Tax=Amorphus orientalis TaxID=649198 RepID=A0AAE4ASK5_9HYPH|nr:bifunctional alpha/beta hydrolase/OsmC family protein [Amorphus orientalis]MDQ0315135.1 putative redox protein [Amorphus orientalis]